MLITFQLNCCGVDGSKDFMNAAEFNKYAQDFAKENGGTVQKLPEACCNLKPRNETNKDEGLFVPIDSNCITVPSTYNSHMLTVSIQHNYQATKFFERYFLLCSL